MTTSVLWFRRDLRLADNPALAAAVAGADQVVPLFVLDPRLTMRAGSPRLAFLYRNLAELDVATGHRLVIRTGDPAEVVPAVAREVEADAVYSAADYGPYGVQRDDQVGMALGWAGVGVHWLGSPYAVAPGELESVDGSAYRVFGPYLRAWLARGWLAPLPRPARLTWASGVDGEPLPAEPAVSAELPPAGENAAHLRLEGFVANQLEGYAERRNQPAKDATSRLSAYLKFGVLHPRQVLARLGEDPDSEALRTELAWREFFAHLLYSSPETAREPMRPEYAALRVDTGPDADDRFAAWAEGRTGYPIVDAGMRQLAGEAWLPNRIRMTVASFLVKDLHLDWRRGAALFLDRLVDGDLASNAHNWQWVTGSGTDAAPFYRVFNPSLQGRKLDPDGRYIRRWVPDLAGVPDEFVHEPWHAPSPPADYPLPIVDHLVERADALDRYQAVRDNVP